MDIFLKEEIVELAKISYDINHGIIRDVSNNPDRNMDEYKFRKKYVIDYINFFQFLIRPGKDPMNIDVDEFNALSIGFNKSDLMYGYNIYDICHQLHKNNLINYCLPDISNAPDQPIIIPNIPGITKNNAGNIIKTGLANPKNRCWFNSFVQLIASIPEIRECFLNTDLTIDPLTPGQLIYSGGGIDFAIKRLEEVTKCINNFDDDCHQELFLKREYLNKIKDNNNNKNSLILLKELIVIINNASHNIKYDFNSSKPSNIQDLYNVFSEKNDNAPYSPKQLGETGDVNAPLMKFIESLNHDNPNLLGLYKIFTVKLIYRSICPSTSKTITTRITDEKIIELKKEKDTDTDLQQILNYTIYNKEEKNGFLRLSSPEYSPLKWIKTYFYDLNSDTRYLFLDTKNWIYNKVTKALEDATHKITVANLITFRSNQFNLFGIVYYISASHFAYQLFTGDGTRTLLNQYDDENDPTNNPINDPNIQKTDTIVTDAQANILIYVRA